MLTVEDITNILNEKKLLDNPNFKKPFESTLKYKTELIEVTTSILQFAKCDFESNLHWESAEEKYNDRKWAEAADYIPIEIREQLKLLKQYYNNDWNTNLSDLGMIIAALINENQLYKAKDILDTIH